MTRSTLVRSALAAAASAGIFIAYTQQAPETLTVTRVADDLHIIVGSGGNVAVYDTPEGAILVDDKFERNVPAILEKVKSVTPRPVRYLINTHQHGDHTGGNAKMLESGAEIVIHEQARANMSSNSMPGLPRLAYADRFSVTLGGKTVRAMHFGRGHTNGDAFVHFPALRTVHTGDMFVAGPPFIDYNNGGSGVDWTGTIDKLLAVDFDTVIPGHGPVMKRADLVAWKESYLKLKEEVMSLRRSGKTKEDAAKMIDPGKFPGWASPTAAGFLTRSFPGLWDELGRR